MDWVSATLSPNPLWIFPQRMDVPLWDSAVEQNSGLLDFCGRHLATPSCSFASQFRHENSVCSLCMLSRFSRVRPLASLWTVACQAPLWILWGFFRQKYWSGLPFPPPGNLPNRGIEPTSLMSLALAGWFFTTSATWETPCSLLPVNCSFLVSFLGSLPWYFSTPYFMFSWCPVLPSSLFSSCLCNSLHYLSLPRMGEILEA